MKGFRLTELLLLYWKRLDQDAWFHPDTIVMIRCDLSRTENLGIPSILK